MNTVWGGYENYQSDLFTIDPEDQPMWRFDKMITTGPRTHYLTIKVMLPLLKRAQKSLAVTISFGDQDKFLGDVQYDAAKFLSTRFSRAFSEKLKDTGVSFVTVYPGFTLTERVAREISEEQRCPTHSTRYVGRVIAALKVDTSLAEKNGKALPVVVLGAEYGIRDLNNEMPAVFHI